MTLKTLIGISLATTATLGALAVQAATPPYPPSPVIAEIRWAPAATIVRQARDGDNWPVT